MHKGAEKAHNIPGHINYYMLATVARRTGVPVPVLANILYCREHQSINHTAWWTIATSTDYHVLLLLLYISIIILVIASTQSLICSSQYADSYIPSFSPTGTSDVCGVDGGGRWVARHSRARRLARRLAWRRRDHPLVVAHQQHERGARRDERKRDEEGPRLLELISCACVVEHV